MNANAIILLMGESGSGKTAIADILEECYGLTQVRSYTTRPKRNPSENCHTFVSQEQFDQLKHLAAYTSFNGYEYCATEEQIQNNNVYIVDPDGVEYFMSHYTGSKIPVVVYISVSSEIRLNRMIARGDSEENAKIRVDHDKTAFRNARSLADLVVANYDLSDAVDQILKFIDQIETQTP